MGPSDPFAGAAPPPTPPPTAERGAGPSGTTTMPGGVGVSGGAGPYRVQARPSPGPAGARASAPALGAALGLVFGLVTIVAGFGPALVVLAFALVGAAVGALARAAGDGGLDVAGAWRALRRRP